MKTLFITAGPVTWASSRLRAFWPAAYMDADVVEFSHRSDIDANGYDAIVFQKAFDLRDVKIAREHGKRVFMDFCDPVWWFAPEGTREIIQYVDGVVCSNTNLTNDFMEWSQGSVPAYTIPDRLEMEAFPARRVQADVTPVRMIWFGLAGNRAGLFSAIANMERLGANGYPIELTVYDERPDQNISDAYFSVYHTLWSLDAECEVLSSHDLAVLPPYPGSWGRVKSINRALTAWACGLAVSDGQDYYALARLVEDWQARKINADAGLALVKREYDVRQSARDWEALLCKS